MERASHIDADVFRLGSNYSAIGTLSLNGRPYKLYGSVDILCDEIEARCMNATFFTDKIEKKAP